MATPAYNELYLSDAMKTLAHFVDYSIHECGFDPDELGFAWYKSEACRLFSKGNPWMISGKSGYELAEVVILESYPNFHFPKPVYRYERTPEYWAGWALAQYQFESSRSFRDILTTVPLSEWISMYPLYHEMDITRVIEAIDAKMKERQKETKLQRYRKANQLSQSELAKLSNTNIRSIQLYEQRVNDINKAHAETLYYLSKALHCSMEDLLEH